MKNIFLLLLLSVSFTLQAQNHVAKDSTFEQLRTLIESGNFRLEVNRAYPSGGRSVDLFSNRGFVNVKDSVATGFFPFFGRAYSAPLNGEGGIEFNAPMKKITLTVKNKKKNKRILYHFQVKGTNDTYDIYVDASASGSCMVSVRSNQKSHISYSGDVFPLPEKSSKP